MFNLLARSFSPVLVIQEVRIPTVVFFVFFFLRCAWSGFDERQKADLNVFCFLQNVLQFPK